MYEAKVCSTSSVWMATSVQTELGAACLDDAWIFLFVLIWPLPFSGAHESLSISCVVYLLFANSRKMVYMS